MAEDRVDRARSALRRRPRARSGRDRQREWARDGPKICLRIFAKEDELRELNAHRNGQLRWATRQLEKLQYELQRPVHRFGQDWPDIAESANTAVSTLLAGGDPAGLDGPIAALGLLHLLDASYAELEAAQTKNAAQRAEREAERTQLKGDCAALESEIADIQASISEQRIAIAGMEAQLEGAQASLSARWSERDEAWQQVIEQLRWKLHTGERPASLANYCHVRDVTGRLDHEFEAELALDLPADEPEIPFDIQAFLADDPGPSPDDSSWTSVNRALEDLALSGRVATALRRAGITDEEDLRATDIEGLREVPGIGEVALTEIRNVIEGRGGAR